MCTCANSASRHVSRRPARSSHVAPTSVVVVAHRKHGADDGVGSQVQRVEWARRARILVVHEEARLVHLRLRHRPIANRRGGRARQLLQGVEDVLAPTLVLDLLTGVRIMLVNLRALCEPARAALTEELVGEARDVLKGRVCEARMVEGGREKGGRSAGAACGRRTRAKGVNE